MKKHILLIAIILHPILAFAGLMPPMVDGIYYLFNSSDKTAIVTCVFSNCYSGDITIPSEVAYENEAYSVTAIGEFAFQGCNNLTSITIPNSVTSIEQYAFNNCSQLKTFTIPNSVTNIGEYAFSGCTGLTSITIPNNVTTIGQNAFENTGWYNNQNTGILYLDNWLLGHKGEKPKGELIISDGTRGIAGAAFYECKDLTSVDIANSVSIIGDQAFSGCSGLTTFSISNSVSTIGNDVFRGCSSLTTVTIPNNVTTIAYGAFADCSGLTSVTIPNSVTSINSEAFSGCYAIKSLSLDCTNIGDWFNGNMSIKEVTLGNSVTSIGNYAFRNCSGLAYLTICSSVTSIGQGAFQGCSALEHVNVQVIDLSAFCNNQVVATINNSIRKPICLIDKDGTVINEYIIPDGVTNVGENAFYNCSSLISVFFPNSVISIGDFAFSNCSNLDLVTLPTGLISIGNNAFSSCTGLISVAIPSTVTTIGYGAFAYCSGLTSITIPNSITTIGLYVFQNCSSLTSITIPNSINSIGDYAFYDCSSLTSIVIPNCVTTIGNSAFAKCSNMISVTIGSGTTSIGHNAFSATSLKKTIWLTNTPPSGWTEANGAVNYVSNEQFGNLNNKIVYPFLSSMFEVNGVKYVPISPSERTCDAIDCVHNESIANTNISSTVTFQGIAMSVKNIQPYICYNNRYIKNLTCENDGEIAQYAFDGCSNIEKVTLGNKTTVIGDYAFQDCSSLQNLFIRDAVTQLGKYSFSGCTALSDVTIGSHVSSIGENSFRNCKNLSHISIPKSVATIDNYAFSGCSGLKNLIVENRNEELALGSNGHNPLFSDCPLDSVYIGGNITYNTSSNCGYSPFYRNTSLRSVVITDKETEISENEFYGCTNLQSFTVGDGVTTFGDWAFSGCSSLKKLSFGYKLESIGKEAFSDCNSVTQIFSRVSTPPVCGSQALDDINKWTCKLYVPTGSMSAYQQADQWKEFFFMEEMQTGIQTAQTDKSSVVDVYDLNGNKQKLNSKGLKIIRLSNGTKKKVLMK